MARLLNSLPEGDLTGSAYDPKGTPWAKRAKSTLDSILQSVQQERIQNRNRSILQSILANGGINGPVGTAPGATPNVNPGSAMPRSMPVDLSTAPAPGIGAMAGPTAPSVAPKANSVLSKIVSGVGGMFDPTASPGNPTEFEQQVAIQQMKNNAVLARGQQTKTNQGPTDFQLWQQAQKEVLAEAGGSALAGVADEKARAELKTKAMERFKELKVQFTPGATPESGTGGGTGGQAEGAYKEGTEAYNPRTKQRIKLVNGKWVPVK